MKKILSFILSFAAISSMVSCDANKDRFKTEKYYISYGQVVKDGTDYNVLLDEGVILEIVENNSPSFTFSSGARVVVNYSVIESSKNDDDVTVYQARVNAISGILCKRTIDIADLDTQEKLDEVGEDPIEVRDVWFSANKYMNIEFIIKIDDEEHLLNAVVTETEGQDMTIELRHNANDDDEKVQAKGVVSFMIDDLVEEMSGKVNITLEWTDYFGNQNEKLCVFEIKDDADDDADGDADEVSMTSRQNFTTPSAVK